MEGKNMISVNLKNLSVIYKIKEIFNQNVKILFRFTSFKILIARSQRVLKY